MSKISRLLRPGGIREAWARIGVCGPANAYRVQMLPSRPVDSPPLQVAIRPLHNAVVELRAGTSDGTVVWATFVGEFHLPPRSVEFDTVRTVLDLGTNIGLTVAHLAVTLPNATVRGFELHGPTAELARRNIQTWADRCSITTAAVWTDDGEIFYEHSTGHESGNHVSARADGTTLLKSPALSLNGIIGEDQIDYVKMDVEGAEQELLRQNTEWAERVRSMKVEVHAPYTVPECQQDLQALGFDTLVDTAHPACVVATRRV